MAARAAMIAAGLPIRCVALNMTVADGVVHPDLVLDTDNATLVAHRAIDIRRDCLDHTLSLP